jgi:hypothetical protein
MAHNVGYCVAAGMSEVRGGPEVSCTQAEWSVATSSNLRQTTILDGSEHNPTLAAWKTQQGSSMTDAETRLVARLYELFTDGNDLRTSPSFSPLRAEFVEKLLHHDRRALPDDMTDYLACTIVTTVGTETTLRHYLPRIVEIAFSGYVGAATWWRFAGTLCRVGFSAWSTEERRSAINALKCWLAREEGDALFTDMLEWDPATVCPGEPERQARLAGEIALTRQRYELFRPEVAIVTPLRALVRLLDDTTEYLDQNCLAFLIEQDEQTSAADGR